MKIDTPHRHRPSDDSFYHVRDADLTGRACAGTACFVARHLDPARFAASAGEPRLECAGACHRGPALFGDDVRPAITVASAAPVLLERIVHGPTRSLAAYEATGGYVALRGALRRKPSEVVETIDAAGLRGRGGAGFPAARKWRAVAAEPAAQKYVVANADEGDAGAYLDRYLIEDDPFALLEALTLAAYAVGATRGVVYLRAEYPLAAGVLRAAFAEARSAGLLGSDVAGSGVAFDVELVVGRGSYVCGEETALLESVEGRHPRVRARPPYPTTRGLFGRPTLVSNVETLVNVPWMLRHGAEAWRAPGIANSRGTKVFSLNSLFVRPGLYEVDLGTPVRALVETLAGGLRDGVLKGVIVGGPLAGVLLPARLDTPLGFEEMRAAGAAVGHGGVIAFDERTSARDLLLHAFEFGADESCGQCTPCRLGTRRVAEIVAAGGSRAELDALLSVLSRASLCGHGSGLSELATSLLTHFASELDPWFA